MASSIQTGEAPRPDARAEPHSVAVVATTAAARGKGEPVPSPSGFTPGTIAASLAVLVVFITVWEWLPRAVGVPEFILPPPSKVWSEFLRMLANERLLWHTG
ncbi:MAG TPA: hypothetical protein VLC73_16735, partial [Burkholderiales bacterium]|nr:hypothetical protein [Burkholderiales bacterium]